MILSKEGKHATMTRLCSEYASTPILPAANFGSRIAIDALATANRVQNEVRPQGS